MEVFFLEDNDFNITTEASTISSEEEIIKLKQAQTIAVEQLKFLKENLLKKYLEIEADIIDGHIMIINDAPIVDAILEYIAKSHMAILACALGIPALVGMGNDVLFLKEEQTVIVDAVADRLITNPSDILILKANEYGKKQKAQKQKEE